jgi:outer membrane immunogenic protein
MKKYLGALAVASLIAGPAFAADMPAWGPAYTKAPSYVPVWSWTGLYIGGNAGYAQGGNTNPHLGFADPTGIGLDAYFASGGNVFPNLRPRGLIGGGQIGYDWQTSNWVYGFVADFQSADIKASGSATVTPPGFITTSTQSISEHLEFLGTARGRLGFAYNNWMFYGTGGLAYGEVRGTLAFNAPGTIPVPLLITGSTSGMHEGWAGGAGINYGLTPNWIIGAEYLHYDLGRADVIAVTAGPGARIPGANISSSQRVEGDMVRGVINYKFNYNF